MTYQQLFETKFSTFSIDPLLDSSPPRTLRSELKQRELATLICFTGWQLSCVRRLIRTENLFERLKFGLNSSLDFHSPLPAHCRQPFFISRLSSSFPACSWNDREMNPKVINELSRQAKLASRLQIQNSNKSEFKRRLQCAIQAKKRNWNQFFLKREKPELFFTGELSLKSF